MTKYPHIDKVPPPDAGAVHGTGREQPEGASHCVAVHCPPSQRHPGQDQHGKSFVLYSSCLLRVTRYS